MCQKCTVNLFSGVQRSVTEDRYERTYYFMYNYRIAVYGERMSNVKYVTMRGVVLIPSLVTLMKVFNIRVLNIMIFVSSDDSTMIQV